MDGLGKYLENLKNSNAQQSRQANKLKEPNVINDNKSNIIKQPSYYQNIYENSQKQKDNEICKDMNSKASFRNSNKNSISEGIQALSKIKSNANLNNDKNQQFESIQSIKYDQYFQQPVSQTPRTQSKQADLLLTNFKDSRQKSLLKNKNLIIDDISDDMDFQEQIKYNDGLFEMQFDNNLYQKEIKNQQQKVDSSNKKSDQPKNLKSQNEFKNEKFETKKSQQNLKPIKIYKNETKIQRKLKPQNLVGTQKQKQDVTCKICNLIVLNPLNCVNCENLFCQECSQNKTNIQCNQGSYCQFKKIYKFAKEMLESTQYKCDYDKDCKFIGKYEDAIFHLQNCEMILTQCFLKCGNCFNQKDLQIHTDFLCENIDIICENCEEPVKPNQKDFHHNCLEHLKNIIKTLREKQK